MKKLTPPELDSCMVYSSIKDNCHSKEKKERLRKLQEYVFSRYEVYNQHQKCLEQIACSNINDQEDKKALESCYSRNENGYLEGRVVSKIISLQSPQHKQKCPYCGIDKPRTIDHYLPKSEFPEFSIFPPNLLPCCSFCNSKKNDRWKNENGRMFVNLYYDDLPVSQFLFADITFNEQEVLEDKTPIVRFNLNNNCGINNDLFELIKSHYTNLDLLEEYSKIVEEDLSNIYDKILNNPNLEIRDHLENICMEKEMLVRKYGVNYWKAVLYDALINNPDVLSTFKSK